METQIKSPALIYAETHSFSHDISHCNPLEDMTDKCHSCFRWAAHLQLGLQPERFEDGLYSYFSEPLLSCINKDYKLYSPIQ